SLHRVADYRPERAWRFVAPVLPQTAISSKAAAPVPDPARPGALLHEVRGIDAPSELLSGPERIESGWWDGGDATRDYYVARAEDGARLWVFQDLAEGAWYLQGLWT
ncbi:MAG TPA: hypothetical protein VII41_12925, partial [Steroidobacteraceae bacterium]